MYETGLFAVAVPIGRKSTIGWAEVEVDVLGQPIMRMTLLVPEGFGSSDLHWNEDFGLRISRVDGPQVELLVAEDGYGYRMVIGASETPDLYDEFITLTSETSGRDAFALLVQAAAPIARFGPVTDELVEGLRREFVDGISVDEMLETRGREPIEPIVEEG